MSLASQKATELDAFTASIDPAAARLRYCLDRSVPIFNDRAWSADGKSAYMAATILGIERDQSHTLLGRAHFKGVERALSYHVEDPFFSKIEVGPLSKRALGWVYFAKSVNYPHVLKIGFSASVDKRLPQVSRIYGEPIELVRAYAGTKMDERQEHVRRWRDNCAHEWFFDPESACREIPPFLLPENIAVKVEGRRNRVAGLQRTLVALRAKAIP